MNDMIVASNRIKSRRYDLVIDGKVVENSLSRQMAKTLADEYREEGFAVDMIESFAVTKANKIVGYHPVKERAWVDPRKELLTPSATDRKIERDRVNNRIKNELAAAKKGRLTRSSRKISIGKSKDSALHQMYLEALKREGYRVCVKSTNQVWFGLQKEIAERIWKYLNSGGDKANLDIKYIGSK